MLNKNGEWVQLDETDTAICNDCECEENEHCKRFNKSILSSYDFSFIKKVWKCFIAKDKEVEVVDGSK